MTAVTLLLGAAAAVCVVSSMGAALAEPVVVKLPAGTGHTILAGAISVLCGACGGWCIASISTLIRRVSDFDRTAAACGICGGIATSVLAWLFFTGAIVVMEVASA